MSGICGLVRFGGGPVTAAELHSMADAAPHRAPDGTGAHLDEGVGLAHLALHLAPEDAPGAQPLQQGGLVIVADARLDARGELIDLLRGAGEPLGAAPSDAHLILAAYRTWGTAAPERLLGDFAFALWDAPKRRLFAARDAMAMRALHYHRSGDRFAFATEIKQILALPGVPTEIFEPMVGAFLCGTFGAPDWTFYRGVAQLPAAHALVADAGGTRTWRYWHADPDARIRYRSEGEYAEHLRELFASALRDRLRCTRPAGVLLSGGVDSGAIAATAGWLRERGELAAAPRTYSWAFERYPECDERHVSRGITSRYDLAARDVPADDAGPLAGYPEHGPDRDEPRFGPFQPLIERASALARDDGVRLVLSGDRGDLVAGGWVLRYTELLRERRWRDLAGELRAHREVPGASLAGIVGRDLVRPLAAVARRRVRRAVRRRGRGRGRGRWPRIPPWIDPDFARRVDLERVIELERPDIPPMEYSRRVRYELLFAPMHMRGVVWSERTHARFGQGFADPWSDRRLVEFALAVPQQVLNRPGELDKRLARAALRGIVPETTLRAMGKIVPTSLYQETMRGSARPVVERLLDPQRSVSAARGFVRPAELGAGYGRLLRGEYEHPAFWWALALEAWLRRYA